MKLLPKVALKVLLVFILGVVGILGWFFFYQGDLPDVGLLTQFAPEAPGVVSDVCLSKAITVVPAREVPKQMRAAIQAAEPEETRPFQVARSLVCGPKRYTNLSYALDQYRLVWRIRWRFSSDQVLTIYMNRVYFAHDTFGVADASHHFFGKQPKDLNVANAALLAGIIRSPGRFSPQKYPDVALKRRNEVIEEMRLQGAISSTEASNAEATPLGVLPQAPIA